jgi:hypothetical protein
MKRIGLSLLLLLTLGVNGCWFHLKKPKPAVIPPPPVVAPKPTPEIKPEIKPEIPPETKPEFRPEVPPEFPPVEVAPAPPEQKPAAKPATKRTPRKAAQPVVVAAPAAPPAAPPVAAPAPAPVPQLGVLLTPEQRSQYEADYTRDLARAQDGLARSAEHSLSPAQKESVSRIRSFMRQAEELHGRDLATAAQLALRAAVLAQDLAESLR